jgi:hypothetical protein
MLLRNTIAVETRVVEVTNPKKARLREGAVPVRLWPASSIASSSPLPLE